MAANNTIRVTVVGDSRSLKSALKDSERSLQSLDKSAAKSQQSLAKMDAGFSSVGKWAALAAGASAVTAAFLKVTDAASRLQTASAANARVFGDQTGRMQEAAKAAQDYGLSQADFLQTSAKLGAQLQNLGMSQDQAATSSQSLMRMGENLAAVFGTDVPQAVTAISAALRGEFDPLEQYGVKLTAAKVAAEQSSKGISQAQAVMNLAMEQSKFSVGAAASAMNTYAGKQRAFAASWENAQASIGEGFLPAASAAVDVLSTMAGWVTAIPAGLRELAGTAIAAGLAIKGLQVLMGMGAAKTAGWAASLKATEMYVANGATSMGRLSTGLTKAANALPVVGAIVIGLAEAFSFLNEKATEAAVSQEKLTEAVAGMGSVTSISTVAQQMRDFGQAQRDLQSDSTGVVGAFKQLGGLFLNWGTNSGIASMNQSIDNLNTALTEFMAVNPAAGAAAARMAFDQLVASGVPAAEAASALAGSLAQADAITRQYGQDVIDAAGKTQALVAAFDAASARATAFGHALDALFAGLDVDVAMQNFRTAIAGIKQMLSGGIDASEIQQLSQAWRSVSEAMFKSGASTSEIIARYDQMRNAMARALAQVGVKGKEAQRILDEVFGKRREVVATVKANADPAIDQAKRAEKVLNEIKQNSPAKILARWLGQGDTSRADRDIDGVRQNSPARIDADASPAAAAASTAQDALSAVERTYTAVLNVVLNLGEGVSAWLSRVGLGFGDRDDYPFDDDPWMGAQMRADSMTEFLRATAAGRRSAAKNVEQVVVVRLKTEGDFTVTIKNLQKLQDLANQTNKKGKLTAAAKQAREELRIRRELADAANEFMRNVTTAYQGEERAYAWLRRKLDSLREARAQLAREMAEAINAVNIGGAWSQMQSNASELQSTVSSLRDEMDGLRKSRAETWNPRLIEYYNRKIIETAVKLRAAQEAQSQNTLGKQLQEQLNRTRRFYDRINELRRKGMSNAALQELVRTGADQGAAIADALAGSDALRRKYDDVFKEAGKMSRSLGETIADDAYAARIKEIEGAIRRLKREVEKWLKAHKKIQWTINWVDVGPKNGTRAYASPSLSDAATTRQSTRTQPQRIDLHVHGNLVDPEGAARAIKKLLRDSANRNGKVTWAA